MDPFLGSLRSMQQLELNDVQNDREMNYMLSKIDGGKITTESISYSAADKEVSSPTQPKTLQQEFSLININIPNIEVNANITYS